MGRSFRSPASLVPPPLWHPPLSDSSVVPIPGADLNAGNTHRIARAVSPLGGRDGARGASLIGISLRVMGNFCDIVTVKPVKKHQDFPFS